MPRTDASPAAAQPPVLQVHGLRFAYPGQAPPLFDGWSFDLAPGLTRLDMDSGKTTLLHLLAGTLHGEGRFVLQGRPWRPAPGDATVCWIDPRDPAWDDCTPAQLMAAVRERHAGLDPAAWHQHLAGFDLLEQGAKTMHMLSTGSRRKVALAASLAAGAPLTLFDEPTAGLDGPAIAWLAQALAALALEPARSWLLSADWGLEHRLPATALLSR